jgi:hypothetical protein
MTKTARKGVLGADSNEKDLDETEDSSNTETLSRKRKASSKAPKEKKAHPQELEATPVELDEASDTDPMDIVSEASSAASTGIIGRRLSKGKVSTGQLDKNPEVLEQKESPANSAKGKMTKSSRLNDEGRTT